MIKKMLIVLSSFLVLGCVSTYNYSILQSPETKMDASKGVLISIPEDGWYQNTQYHNSGRMTANAVRAAFSKNAYIVDISDECNEDCLDNINVDEYGYYVKPLILHWEERATEWSGKQDRIEIQIIIFDVATKEELSNFSYSGKSKWMSFGGDHPQDLLQTPTNKAVNNLY